MVHRDAGEALTEPCRDLSSQGLPFLHHQAAPPPFKPGPHASIHPQCLAWISGVAGTQQGRVWAPNFLRGAGPDGPRRWFLSWSPRLTFLPPLKKK